MVNRSFIVVVACFCVFVCQTLLPKVIALTKRQNVNEFMIHDQRTHTRQNYVVQRGLEDEVLDEVENTGPSYVRDHSQKTDSSDALPALVVDYANMIRNDIILLDNSVETRTRKRGNIKRFNQALPDLSCSCESVKELINLGANTIPQYVETKNCSRGVCPPSYRCKDNYYYITVLTRKSDSSEDSVEVLPYQLKHHWIARKIKITTGCFCASDPTTHRN